MEDQKMAEENLEKSREKLGEMKREQLTQRQKERMKELEKLQKDLKQEAEDLSKKLDSLKKEQASKAAQESSQDMQDAKEKMAEEKTSEAAEDQEDAMKRLEQAKREIEQEKWKYENLRQEEVIFNLTGQITEIEKAQTEILNSTKELNEKITKFGITRRDLIALKKLEGDQSGLVTEVDKIIEVLTKEDSQIFNWVFKRIKVSMDEAAKNLRGKDTGILTQSLQKEVVDRLNKLLTALKEEQKRRKEENQQQSPQDENNMQQKPQILPPIAELKMIRDIQMDIKDRTKRIFDTVKEQNTIDDLSRRRLERLGHEEGDLADMTKRFIQSLEGLQTEGE